MKKTLKPTRPSAALRDMYAKELDKLIKEMFNSTHYWLVANYKKDTPKIAMDANIFSIMKSAMNKLTKTWQKKFDDIAKKLATRFVDKGVNHADLTLKNAFKDAGFTVDFKPSDDMKVKIAASIDENVQLIKSIPDKYFGELNFIINQGIQRGFDVGHISEQIRLKYGVTKRRAAFIARDQANKVHSVITQQRQMDAGITQGEWVHSHAGKVPRPSHVKAGKDKLIFDLQKGAFIDGKYILPGQEPNCRCTWHAVLPF